MGGACCTPSDELMESKSLNPVVDKAKTQECWAVHRSTGKEDKEGEDKQEEIRRFLTREDVDKDGQLNPEEAEKICKKFFIRATGLKINKDTTDFDKQMLNVVFDMFDLDSDGYLTEDEFGIMMKVYWLMKAPGLKIDSFLGGNNMKKWEAAVEDFNTRNGIK